MTATYSHSSGITADGVTSERGVWLSFASGRWRLQAGGGMELAPVFAPDPPAVAAAVMQRLREAERETGRAHVVCGLIPFDLNEPASLRITDEARFVPRTREEHGSAPRPVRSEGLIPPVSGRYRAIVCEALERIESGSAHKVVLARSMDVGLPSGTDEARLANDMAERLATADPHADIYLAEDGEGGLWVGASPEVVADVRHGRFLTHPLAGSLSGDVPRAEALSRLTASSKDQREHAHVVRHIAERLDGMSERCEIPASPRLYATDSMWHLGSRITGDLHQGVSALEVAVALHPTPAVCGTPTAQALAIISELETTSRGFYAGLVGWTDSTGDGRWSLVLRGAHVGQGNIRLFAGAGIVAGSEPQAEHQETAAKFATVLRSLEGLL